MIEVHCRTNLDLRGETWPTELPAVPNVGDRIQSATKHHDFQLQLEVCAVTWKSYNNGTRWYPEIELHMTSFQRSLPTPAGSKAEKGSIVAFYHWYAPLVGSIPGAFI